MYMYVVYLSEVRYYSSVTHVMDVPSGIPFVSIVWVLGLRIIQHVYVVKSETLSLIPGG